MKDDGDGKRSVKEMLPDLQKKEKIIERNNVKINCLRNTKFKKSNNKHECSCGFNGIVYVVLKISLSDDLSASSMGAYRYSSNNVCRQFQQLVVKALNMINMIYLSFSYLFVLVQVVHEYVDHLPDGGVVVSQPQQPNCV